jgi:hypothetical protein
MTKPTIKEVNAETGEEIIRDMTPEEITQLEIDKAAYEAEIASITAREALRQSRREKLLALGLTEEELDA